MDSDDLFYLIKSWMLMFVWGGSTVSAIQVRNELESNQEDIKETKLKSYILHLINLFGGAALTNLALNSSPLLSLNNSAHVFCATAVWLLTIYGHDCILDVLKSKISIVFCSTMNEIWRCFKILSGIQAASLVFQPNWTCLFLLAFVGLLKGGGVELVKNKCEVSTPTKLFFISSSLLSITLYAFPEYMSTMFCVIVTMTVAIQVTCAIMSEESSYENLVKASTWIAFALLCIVATSHITVYLSTIPNVF